MREFLYMGGYAGYVWSAYGLTLLVLAANIVAARSKVSAVLKSLRARIRREQRPKNR